MVEADLGLDELSERSGVPSRLIRSYIEQGLLRGPASKGRYARYSGYHLDRLLAIRALRGQGLSLADVRARLISMSDEQIARAGATAEAAAPASALEYLRRVSGDPRSPVDSSGQLRAFDLIGQSPLPAGPEIRARPLGKPPGETTSFERLLLSLQEVVGSQRVERQARGESWYRIAVTPEIELAIRGALTPEALATLERLADYLREIALGGLGPPAPT